MRFPIYDNGYSKCLRIPYIRKCDRALEQKCDRPCFQKPRLNNVVVVEEIPSLWQRWSWNVCDSHNFVNVTVRSSEKMRSEPEQCKGSRGDSYFYESGDPQIYAKPTNSKMRSCGRAKNCDRPCLQKPILNNARIVLEIRILWQWWSWDVCDSPNFGNATVRPSENMRSAMSTET